jgi:carbon-monoxide dehydrogenase medium subunit
MREFEYFRPTSLAEACALKAQWGAESQILAGGQSLLNMMKVRFAAPACLIDGSRLDELQGVSTAGGGLRIGSMVTYTDVGRAAGQPFGIIADALSVIADMQVRNLGTVGGSCCQADPFGDMPNVVLALRAELEACSINGRRRIAAHDFFQGPLETALNPEEVLYAIHFPAAVPGSGSAYEKFSWRRGDYAIVSIAAVVSLDSSGTCTDCSLVAGAMGLGPVRLRNTEKMLVGQRPSEQAVATVAAAAAVESDPADDPVYGSVEYKRALVETLTGRALTRAIARAQAHSLNGATA